MRVSGLVQFPDFFYAMHSLARFIFAISTVDKNS
jgi:hypothetical protein